VIEPLDSLVLNMLGDTDKYLASKDGPLTGYNSPFLKVPKCIQET